MIRKFLSLSVILGVVATAGLAQSLDVEDVEKATRFRAAESEAAPDAESDAGTASSTEETIAPPGSDENPFDLSKGVDPLEVLGGSSQLEDLGWTSRVRYCWYCRYWICCP